MISFEQKYSMGTQGGKYQIVWDISALISDLKHASFTIENCKVSCLAQSNLFFGDPAYAMRTNLEIPCIIVQLGEDIEKLIDGHHRLYKARQLHRGYMPCYVLPIEYHKKFIVGYDDVVYETVISAYAKEVVLQCCP